MKWISFLRKAIHTHDKRKRYSSPVEWGACRIQPPSVLPPSPWYSSGKACRVYPPNILYSHANICMNILSFPFTNGNRCRRTVPHLLFLQLIIYPGHPPQIGPSRTASFCLMTADYWKMCFKRNKGLFWNVLPGSPRPELMRWETTLQFLPGFLSWELHGLWLAPPERDRQTVSGSGWEGLRLLLQPPTGRGEKKPNQTLEPSVSSADLVNVGTRSLFLALPTPDSQQSRGVQEAQSISMLSGQVIQSAGPYWSRSIWRSLPLTDDRSGTASEAVGALQYPLSARCSSTRVGKVLPTTCLCK